MLYDIIPLIIILVSLAVIIFILVKKFPQLANVNVEQIPQEQQAELKKTIMEGRIKRDLEVAAKKVLAIFRPTGIFLASFLKKLKERIIFLEQKLLLRRRCLIKTKKEKVEEVIKNLISEGEKLLADDEFDRAEKKFIEVLGFDAKNMTAYQNLGEIYLEGKKYNFAMETFNFLVNLDLKKIELLKRKKNIKDRESVLNEVNFRLADYYFEIGEIYKLEGENDKAKEFFEKSLQIIPNNPKYLDFLGEVCIILKKKIQAEEILKRLREINPENQKIEEWEEKIKEL